MRFASIVQDDISNGDGLGEVLFVQYCSHRCPGCQNPSTWSKDGGYRFTEKYLNIILDYFRKNPIARRLTLSGGDPLDNLDISLYVARAFKKEFPNKRLWIFTGYEFSYLISDPKFSEILSLCDILVDGEFHVKERDTTLYCKGSANQNVIDVQASLKSGNLVIHGEDH
jgi:anaerobic ribonucleoside-triphosphate reductase activating protein